MRPALDDGDRAAHLRRADRRHRGQRRVAGRPRDRPRRPDRHPDAVGQLRALRRDPGDAGRRRGLRAGRRRRPRGTGRAGVRRGRRRRRHHRGRAWSRGPGSSRGLARDGAAGPRRRLDHLHLRIDRHAQGRRGHAPQRGGVRRRRGADVPAGQPDRARRPGAGRAVGGVRRVLRGDVAGLAARRLPGARAAVAGAQRHGPRAVAGVPRHHRRLDGADAGGAVARRGAGGGAAADLRRRGLPAGAGRAAGGGGPRGVEHLRADRGDRRRVRGAAGRAPARSASGCRWPAGIWPSSTRTGPPVRVGEVGELVIGGVGLARYLDPDKDAEKYAPMPSLGWTTAPTAAATWSGWSPTACSSWAAPTTRSRSAGGASSSARSTPRWWTCPGSAAAPRRSGGPPAAPRCWSATSSSAPTRRFDLAAARARAGRGAARRAGAAAGRSSTSCRPAPPARSTATRCRGRRRAPGRRPARPRRHAWAGWPGCGATCWPRRSTGRRPTSSPSAAARCRRRSWSPHCAQRYPQVTVADLYDHPRLGSLAGYLDELDAAARGRDPRR